MKKDDIEDLYNELEGFSKAPPEELWNNIEARLHPEKKRRSILFFWGSAAAVLVMFLGYMFTNSIKTNGNPINEISDIEQPVGNDELNESNHENTKMVEGLDEKNKSEDSTTEGLGVAKESLNNLAIQKQLTERNKKSKTISSQNQLVTNRENLEKEDGRSREETSNLGLYEKSRNDKSKNSKYNNRYSQNILKEDVIKEQVDKVNSADVLDLQRKNKTLIDFKKEKIIASNSDSINKPKDVGVLDIIEELVAENENVNDSTLITKVAGLKWSVEVLGGLANTASEASIQNTAVNTTSQNDFVYTLKVGYAITDRLVVKSGIGKNVLGQEINSIKYSGAGNSLAVGDFQNIVNNPNILFLVSEESFNDISSFEEFTDEGVLLQQFDYVQVPLEFSYNLLKAQKFDLSLGLGGNVNFLTNNRAFLDDEKIGENLGANTTIFGATMNSNISYSLAKKTILFLEPSYNYFEKPINNNNQTFENTQLRVLFGLRYKF